MDPPRDNSEHLPPSAAWSWALEEDTQVGQWGAERGMWKLGSAYWALSVYREMCPLHLEKESFREVLLQRTVRPGDKFVSAFPVVL